MHHKCKCNQYFSNVSSLNTPRVIWRTTPLRHLENAHTCLMRLDSRILSDGMNGCLLHIDWQDSLCSRQWWCGGRRSELAIGRSLGHIPSLTGDLGGNNDQCSSLLVHLVTITESPWSMPLRPWLLSGHCSVVAPCSKHAVENKVNCGRNAEMQFLQRGKSLNSGTMSQLFTENWTTEI